MPDSIWARLAKKDMGTPPKEMPQESTRALQVKQSLTGAFSGKQSPEYKYWQDKIKKQSEGE